MAFELFDRVRVHFPLRSRYWTIWKGREQNRWEWFLGHPIEVGFCRYDYIDVACDESGFWVKPHYLLSSWDTFWVEPDGVVRAQAFGGLFQVTLGKQPTLLKGIVSVVSKVPPLLPDRDDTAMKIARIADHLQGLTATAAVQASARPNLRPCAEGGRMRASMSGRCWNWKLRGMI